MGDRRRQIVATGADLARTEGFDQVTVRRVAALVGIGPSTLRHYFPSQRALHDAVADELLDEALLDLRIDDDQVDPVTRLTECLMQFMPPEGQERVLLEAAIAGHVRALGPDREEAYTAFFEGMTRSALGTVERWIRTLHDEGHGSGDAGEQALLLSSLLEGLAVMMLALPDRLDLAQVRRHLEVVVAGIVLADRG